jgi:DinB superfamily
MLRKTPDVLRELLDGVSMDTISEKKGTEWSPRELLIHLIDTELVYGFRFRLIMAEKDPVITPMNQDDWINTFSYGKLNAEQLIRAFTPLRRINLELLQSVNQELFDKKARHPEFGVISVGVMIPHLAAHDQNHLQQIRDRTPVA